MDREEITERVKDELQSLNEGFSSDSADKDKIVVAVAGGALAATIAFVTDTKHAGWSWLLALGLALMLASVVAVLLTFHFNQVEMQRRHKNIHEFLKDPSSQPPPDDPSYYLRIGPRRIRLLNALNSISVFLLSGGLIAVVVFVSMNLEG